MTAHHASSVKVRYELPSAIDTHDGRVPVTCLPAPKTPVRGWHHHRDLHGPGRGGHTRTTSFDVVVTQKQHGRW